MDREDTKTERLGNRDHV